MVLARWLSEARKNMKKISVWISALLHGDQRVHSAKGAVRGALGTPAG
jgi:hypothetical protein